jgi:glycosyltransferase involved in cell wall biosynthesis
MLHYYPHALRGEFGTSSAVRGWCAALSSAGADVTLLVDREGCRVPVPENVSCRPIDHVGSGRWRRPRNLRAFLGPSDILVLHGGWTAANVIAARQARQRGLPYVMTAHGAYADEVVRRGRIRKLLWWVIFERRLVKDALAVHVFFREELRSRLLRSTASQALVAPTGCSLLQGLAWKGGGGYLLWLGRFDPVNKGLDLLLRGLSLIEETSRPRVRMHGPDWKGKRSAVEKLVRDLHLSDWVEVGDAVYGSVKQDALVQTDGFVYPSRWEAFGMALAEAASIGVPTLSTPTYLGKLLAQAEATVLVDADPESVAAGLRRLSSPSAVDVGRRGQEMIRANLSWQQAASKWLQQVESMIRENDLA